MSHWLGDWELIWLGQILLKFYREECEELISIVHGVEDICVAAAKTAFPIFNDDVLVQLSHEAQEIHAKGTSGNAAIRCLANRSKFIITRRGANKQKGKLAIKDLVLIDWVNWDERKLYYYTDSEENQPSTDTLVPWLMFERRHSVNVYVHTHLVFSKVRGMKVKYPVYEKEHLKPFEKMAIKQEDAIAYIGHDYERSGSYHHRDGAMVLGANSRDILYKFEIYLEASV
jgi:ribulose-5-phosphate 4-epimerase/fuculose-1-phosphate aldolase